MAGAGSAVGALLTDGRVLVACLHSQRVYDPDSGAFETAGKLAMTPWPRQRFHPGRRVLLVASDYPLNSSRSDPVFLGPATAHRQAGGVEGGHDVALAVAEDARGEDAAARGEFVAQVRRQQHQERGDQVGEDQIERGLAGRDAAPDGRGCGG